MPWAYGNRRPQCANMNFSAATAAKVRARCVEMASLKCPKKVGGGNDMR